MFLESIKQLTFIISVILVAAVFASLGKHPVKIIELRDDAWICTKTHVIHHDAVILGTPRSPAYDEEECDTYTRK